MSAVVERFLNGLCNTYMHWLGFLPIICIVIGLFCGDRPYRLLLRSSAFLLLTLPLLFKFKDDEFVLSFFMASLGCVVFSVWYYFRVRKHPDFPEALRIAHDEFVTRFLKHSKKQ